MWWIQNKSNLSNAQKWQFLKPLQMMSIIQLVMMTVSLVVAQMQYPKKEKDVLVEKDDNILLSNKFLPFLDECSTNDKIEICSMYYDMVYNVYNLELNGNDIKQSILEANKILDNSKLTAKFCNIFRNESKNALDKQPFSTANNITNITEWIQKNNMCELNCMNYKKGVISIKDVCKFISGGLRSILKEKKKKDDRINLPLSGPGNENENTKLKNEKKPENSKNEKVTNDQGTIQNVIQKSISTSVEKSVVKAASIAVPANTNLNRNSSNPTSTKSLQMQPKTSENLGQLENSAPAAQSPPKMVDVTPKLVKNITSNVDVNKKPNNGNDKVNTNEQTANKQTSASLVDTGNGDEENDKNLNDLTYNEENVAEDDDTDQQQDPEQRVVNGGNIKNTDIDSNNNNNNLKQSRLEADQAAFREDTESSFFPYFMFLMFVVVTLYVAYHNKSKILALMIEGRRSRNYSSRSGGRRKHSSAEYRKLDSNLEEAIQSDGHVLSTQIIY